MNFFSFLLLQSPTFDWASSFLLSKAWNFLSTKMSSSSKGTLFTVPKSCPLVDFTIYSNLESTFFVVLEPLSEDIDMDLPGSSIAHDMTTPPRASKKSKGKAPLLEADVRRSTRLKMVNRGFKSSACKDRNCHGCWADPPTISSKVIRSLGETFYGINPEDLFPSKLNAKPTKKKTVSKKKAPSKSGKKTTGKKPSDDVKPLSA